MQRPPTPIPPRPTNLVQDKTISANTGFVIIGTVFVVFLVAGATWWLYLLITTRTVLVKDKWFHTEARLEYPDPPLKLLMDPVTNLNSRFFVEPDHGTMKCGRA